MPFFRISQYLHYSQVHRKEFEDLYSIDTNRVKLFAPQIVFFKNVLDLRKYLFDHYNDLQIIIVMIEDFKNLISFVACNYFCKDSTGNGYDSIITNASNIDKEITECIEDFNFQEYHEIESIVKKLNSLFGRKNITSSLGHTLINRKEINDLQTEYNNFDCLDLVYGENEKDTKDREDYFWYFQWAILDKNTKEYMALLGVQLDTKEGFKEIPLRKVKWLRNHFGIVDNQS